MLQWDRMIHKGADIRRLLDQQITQWHEGLFDLLIQEADRCDRALKHFCGAKLTEDGNVQIFSDLMLQGKVRAAVCWATEHARGNVLFPTNLFGDLHKDNTNVTIIDILHQKHPAAQTPKASALVMCDTLPLLEDVVEITGSHILFIAHSV